jgi:hypothetical protein
MQTAYFDDLTQPSISYFVPSFPKTQLYFIFDVHEQLHFLKYNSFWTKLKPKSVHITDNATQCS